MAKRGYQGQITASVRYEDEIPILKEEGINAAYSLYEEAGVGFADHVCDHMYYCKLKDAGLKSWRKGLAMIFCHDGRSAKLIYIKSEL